jgi:hypothetical protein
VIEAHPTPSSLQGGSRGLMGGVRPLPIRGASPAEHRKAAPLTPLIDATGCRLSVCSPALLPGERLWTLTLMASMGDAVCVRVQRAGVSTWALAKP